MYNIKTEKSFETYEKYIEYLLHMEEIRKEEEKFYVNSYYDWFGRIDFGV